MLPPRGPSTTCLAYILSELVIALLFRAFPKLFFILKDLVSVFNREINGGLKKKNKSKTETRNQ